MTTTYTELLPVTKSSRHSGLNWTPSGDDFGPVAGTLVLWTDRTTATYAVTEFGVTWDGRGFVLAKTDGTESYSVFCHRGGQDHCCECKGFQAHGHCKHTDAVTALIQNGWL